MYDDAVLPNVVSWELLLEFPAEKAILNGLLVSFLCSSSTSSSFLPRELSSSRDLLRRIPLKVRAISAKIIY